MRTFIRTLFLYSLSALSLWAAEAPQALRCNLIEHSDRCFVNGEIVQISLADTKNIVESVQSVLIESKEPFFSWLINDERRNIKQVAYQIQVSTSLDKDFGDVWDSTKTDGGLSQAIYNSKTALKEDSLYYWRVRYWNNRGEESPWSKPKAFKTGAELRDYSSSYYPITKRLQSFASKKKIAGNLYFYDFAKAGFARLKITATTNKCNDTLIVRFGEVLKDDGRLNSNAGGSRRFREVKLKLIEGTHTYFIAIEKDARNASGDAILMPEYMGDVYPFRYCEIEGSAFVDSLHRELVTYPFNNFACEFECSDKVLNDIWDFCKYSIEATSFAGYYVDGDRERIPYEADVYINQLSHYAVDAEYSLARRTQEYLLFRPTWPTEWILSSVLIAWKDYLYTGDSSFIEKYYDDLVNKTLIALTAENNLICTNRAKFTKSIKDSVHYKAKTPMRDIVDWPHRGNFGMDKNNSGETDGFVFSDYNCVSNAYHNFALQIMANIASALGKGKDAKDFAQRASTHKKAFNELFFDKENGRYRDGINIEHSALHSNIFALNFGLVEEENVKSVTDFVESRKMSCSVYGSQHLLDAIYEGENARYGKELLTSTGDRSWTHAIYNVGTTISLEAWDNKYKPNQDWNHAWGAAPANIIVMRMMGLMPLSAGFYKFRIKPQLDDLEWAKLSYSTMRGKIDLEITNKENFEMKFKIPANTTAEIFVPCAKDIQGKLFLNGKEFEAKRVRDFFYLGTFSSGTYSILLKNTK
ncbi:MAG: alpha-L-rhamnosidase C-terminal domain-containing protein [Opitutales bacterium]